MQSSVSDRSCVCIQSRPQNVSQHHRAFTYLSTRIVPTNAHFLFSHTFALSIDWFKGCKHEKKEKKMNKNELRSVFFTPPPSLWKLICIPSASHQQFCTNKPSSYIGKILHTPRTHCHLHRRREVLQSRNPLFTCALTSPHILKIASFAHIQPADGSAGAERC